MFPDGLNPPTSHGLLQPFSIFLMFSLRGLHRASRQPREPPLAIVWLDLPEFLGVVCRFLLVFTLNLQQRGCPSCLYSANITPFFQALEATKPV